MKWYQLSSTKVIEQTKTKQTGLSSEERQQRLQTNGPNKIEEKQQLKTWQKLAKHFTDLLMVVLLAAAILKFATGEVVEGSIIFLVVLVNGFVGYWQERKAEESLDGLKQMMGQEAVVLIDGQKTTVSSETLVLGDVVTLQAGDVVPADLRLFDVHNLMIEESILTGESEAVEKITGSLNEELPTGDQKNLAFSGTLVQAGSALGVVVETGDSTEVGKINHALQSVDQKTTPLVRKMHQLNKQIFQGIMVLIVFLIFFTTFRHGMEWSLLFSAMIALIVAMIPEGLPAVLTMILSMGVHEMARENAIIKGMPSVETLGSMTVICSDKTGTLTKNEMTVMDVVTEEMTIVKEIMANCQELKLQDQQKIADLQGNPTELALLQYVDQDQLSLRPVEKKIPFSSSYKYMATRHPQAEGSIIYVKGAPEVLLQLSTLSDNQKGAWQAQAAQLAQKGQRVLGFAYKTVTSQQELTHETLSGLTFAGLAGIIDPPKESAIQAVKESQEAGISVKMITGDHKDTAQAIGEQVGLKHTKKVLEGLEIDAMSDEELAQHVQKVDVFARTTPEHKLRIVTALQNNGEIVGMTGDGVNDSPALKRADVGFAMGSGTEAAKEAGKIVILDDNFKSIKDAIWYGRTIYHNILKFCKFQLVINVAAVVVSAVAPFFGVEEPLKVTHLLFVNLVMDSLGAIMLGNEPALEKYMTEKPRRRDENIVSRKMMGQILTMGAWLTAISFVYLKLPFFTGLFENEAQHLTGYFVLFIVSALFNGFNVRDDAYGIFQGLNENTGFLKVFFTIILVQALIVNAALIPFPLFTWIGNMFSCVPFGITGWIAVAALGVTMIPVDMLRKAVTGSGKE